MLAKNFSKYIVPTHLKDIKFKKTWSLGILSMAWTEIYKCLILLFIVVTYGPIYPHEEKSIKGSISQKNPDLLVIELCNELQQFSVKHKFLSRSSRLALSQLLVE